MSTLNETENEDVALDFDIVELVACPGMPTDTQTMHSLREIAFRVDAWTSDELAVLTEKFRADEPLQEIAVGIGRTLAAVRNKLYELGLRRNSSRPWAEMEDQLLLAEYGTVASATVAAMLGRTVSAIYARAAGLGLTEEIAPAWTAWEDAQLAAGYRDGIPALQLASLIGRPLSGAVSRASALGLRHKNWNPAWTEGEKALAIELVEQGRTSREIGMTFEQHGFRTRSKNAVGPILRALGFERTWGRAWLAEEVDALRRVYADGGSVAKLASRLGRSRTSLTWKVEELGLSGTHVNAGRGFRQGDDWTEAELTVLRSRYGTEKVKETAAALQRPLGAIYNKAHALGLEAKYHRDWSPEEDRAIAIAYGAGISMTDLAIAVDRNVATLSKRAIKLNLPFRDRPTGASRARRSEREKITLQDILEIGESAEHQWARELVAPVPKRRGKAPGSRIAEQTVPSTGQVRIHKRPPGL